MRWIVIVLILLIASPACAYEIVVIGDSLMLGCYHNTYAATDRLRALILNKGTGGDTIAMVEARFDADVVAYNPTVVVINSGVNDLIGGATDPASFITSWTSILNKCVAANIIPVVVKIAPWENGIAAGKESTRATWDEALVTLVSGYPIATILDISTMTEDDAGVPCTACRWQAGLSDDGLHPNALGYFRLNALIRAAVLEVGPYVTTETLGQATDYPKAYLIEYAGTEYKIYNHK